MYAVLKRHATLQEEMLFVSGLIESQGAFLHFYLDSYQMAEDFLPGQCAEHEPGMKIG